MANENNYIQPTILNDLNPLSTAVSWSDYKISHIFEEEEADDQTQHIFILSINVLHLLCVFE